MTTDPDPAVTAALAALRDIIRDVGTTATPAGLVETTKWGQAAFLPRSEERRVGKEC